MAREPMILPPPSQVWLTHTPGLYGMARTSDRDGDSIRYVLGSDYDELLDWAERSIVNGEACGCSRPRLNEPFGDSEQLPPSPTPPAPGHEREGRQSPRCTCTADPSITCIVHPQEVPDGEP